MGHSRYGGVAAPSTGQIEPEMKFLRSRIDLLAPARLLCERVPDSQTAF
jgi:hypothetical protein